MKTNCRAAFVAVAVVFSTQTLANVQPLKGEWVGDGVACSALETYADERIMKIGTSSIEFYESECVLRNVSRTGDTFRLDLRCEGEGESFRQSLSLTLEGPNRISLEDGLSYVRC